MKILLKHKKFEGSIIFTYDDKGRCIAFAFNCEITSELWDFIFEYFPAHYESIKNKCFANFQKIDVPEDTSFEAFWKVYNYKIGNKERAKKLWELLDEQTRVLVFNSIKKYATFLANKPSMEKAYPETWLKQRRWENSFE